MKKLFLLFSLFFASSVWAQDQATGEAENEPQNEQQAKDIDTDLSSEEVAAAENDELILGDEVEEQEEEGSNSRFIPTEEISQDLGVSFPVDI